MGIKDTHKHDTSGEEVIPIDGITAGEGRIILERLTSYIKTEQDKSDESWKDWDLDDSTTVPTNAKAVMLVVQVRDSGSSTFNASMSFRKNGETSGKQNYPVFCFAPDDALTTQFVIVEMDDNHVIEYSINASGSNTFDYFIKLWGWILWA